MKPDDYDRHDALGLADLIRRGEVSALEVCQAAIARIEALNPALNAVVAHRFDRACSEARRIAPRQVQIFAGVPMLLKDLIQQHRDLPSTEGTRLLVHRRPARTSELTLRMEATGAIVLGKTNTPELGLSPTTEPHLFGPCRNPWNVRRTTGGSSGGSAAAVAAGMVPIAHGNDGGGSIRVPASCCGVFGFKPSRGRNPPGPPPYHPVCSLLTVEHVLTRSVRDSAAMLDATCGAQSAALFALAAPRAPHFLAALHRPPERLRCAVLDEPLFNRALHPVCRSAVHEAAKLLGRLGHTVELVSSLPIDANALAEAFLVILLAECAHVIEAFQGQLGRRARTYEIEPMTWVLNVLGRGMGMTELAKALARVQDAQWAMQRFHERIHILVSPVLAAPPLPLGCNTITPVEQILIRLFHRVLTPPATWVIRRRVVREAFEWIGYTQLANLTGLPAMSVPLHWAPDGLPIGVQMSASFGGEALLFRLAAQLEEAAPWFHRRPGPITETKQSPSNGTRLAMPVQDDLLRSS
jgi:amidase